MAGEIELDSGIMTSAVNLQRLRDMVRGYIDKHQYNSALFWADKLVSLSKGETQDVYWYAQTQYLTGEFHRAANLITSKKLHKTHVACRYLAAKCHYETKEYQEALDILDLVESTGQKTPVNNSSTSLTSSASKHEKSMVVEEEAGIPVKGISACICLLRGLVYSGMDNRNLAAECFREALQLDVHCYEAFDYLVNNHMLSAQEERDLLESLPFSKQCDLNEIELVRFLYENKLKKYDKPKDLALPTSLSNLCENIDVIINLAERHYYNCDFRECFKITSTVLKESPFNNECLPLHIAVLVELNKPIKLFHLAHRLVDMYPNKPVSWFAVGCYYLVVGKNEPARRYFSKATALDRVFSPAWLAFGHSFASENEHDQAMAAYFTASQLMKGCHLPVLYIGLEYGLTNNPKLAERFFSQALSIAPEDPFVLHEMGVIAFQNQDWETAEKFFRDALDKIRAVSREMIPETWEPLLNNLGHVCRKLKKYDESLEFHRRALILSPQNPSTYSTIGYVYALTGESSLAVDYFHRALGLRRDDTFSTTMLTNSIEQLMGEMAPCEDMTQEPILTGTTKFSSSSLAETSTISEPSLIETSTLSDASLAIDIDMEGNN
ncbi:cell division cycle protein 16 homolog [Tubulanus polymorphus]|uniref:cell division cycle protein 16 homolog n=1 Tax=Tubulanus polymorphus TaxID=672921 RepID=UPI003DA5356F